MFYAEVSHRGKRVVRVNHGFHLRAWEMGYSFQSSQNVGHSQRNTLRKEGAVQGETLVLSSFSTDVSSVHHILRTNINAG